MSQDFNLSQHRSPCCGEWIRVSSGPTRESTWLECSYCDSELMDEELNKDFWEYMEKEYPSIYPKKNIKPDTKQLNSHMFKEVYEKLGINLDTLGCIMLDLDPINNEYIREEDLYHTKKEDRFWIKGWVAGKTPHITLLYGLLESGKNFEPHINQVLTGWEYKECEIDHVGVFNSPYEDDPYYCIVAHIKVTPELLEGHQRLEFLPHINTFAGYKPHLTLCYIRKDDELRDSVVEILNDKLTNKKLPIKIGVNLGDKK